eukprot:scaffold1193_cov71-Phaeocystis_antarctica.AAC.2
MFALSWQRRLNPSSRGGPKRKTRHLRTYHGSCHKRSELGVTRNWGDGGARQAEALSASSTAGDGVPCGGSCTGGGAAFGCVVGHVRPGQRGLADVVEPPCDVELGALGRTRPVALRQMKRALVSGRHACDPPVVSVAVGGQTIRPRLQLVHERAAAEPDLLSTARSSGAVGVLVRVRTAPHQLLGDAHALLPRRWTCVAAQWRRGAANHGDVRRGNRVEDYLRARLSCQQAHEQGREVGAQRTTNWAMVARWPTSATAPKPSGVSNMV